jgi:hypothetical protein
MTAAGRIATVVRRSLTGHYPTSVYSEADGGYDRIQGGADRARRRALRAAVPEADVQGVPAPVDGGNLRERQLPMVTNRRYRP